MARVETIAFEENNSVGTLNRVVQGRAVLITTRDFGETIQRYYTNVGFHVSKEGFYSTMENFAMRHGLDPRRRERLARL